MAMESRTRTLLEKHPDFSVSLSGALGGRDEFPTSTAAAVGETDDAIVGTSAAVGATSLELLSDDGGALMGTELELQDK